MEVSKFDKPENFKNILVQLSAQPADVVESEQLEVKGWCRDEKQLIEKVSEAAACLANAEGGAVLVGVEDEARGATKFSRCPYPDLSPQWLIQRVHDLTSPPVECSAYDLSDLVSQVLGVDGSNAFVLCIPRTKHVSGHLTVKGISKIRVGKECRPYYTAEDDRTRAVVPEASLDDLSITSIRWAISQHQKRFQTAKQEWNEPWDFLVQARLLEVCENNEPGQSKFRVPLATIILFGKEAALSRVLPFCETLIVTGAGTRRIRKNAVESVREICGGESPIVSALCPGVPAETFRELLVNAYIHRCYRTSGPVVITAAGSSIDIQNPGELPIGLHSENLIYCVPIYRNLLLADGARFFGLCDKIGQGIDLVFRSVLEGGFDFPMFESGGSRFTVRLNLDRSGEFGEFVRRRSASLSQLEEIVVLRVLWSQETAAPPQLASTMQRSQQVAGRVLDSMCKKLMIEQVPGTPHLVRLTPIVRRDIESVFKADQMSLLQF